MTYAQFYDKAIYPINSTELIEVCGDRGIIYLDGRESLQSQIELCEQCAHERNYQGYKIYKGDTINRDTKELFSNVRGA